MTANPTAIAMATPNAVGSNEKSVQAVMPKSTAHSRATGSQFKLNARQARLTSSLFIIDQAAVVLRGNDGDDRAATSAAIRSNSIGISPASSLENRPRKSVRAPAWQSHGKLI